jgi:hypothetical protein
VVAALDEILRRLEAHQERHPRHVHEWLYRRVWMLRLRVLERLPPGRGCRGDHAFLVDRSLRPSRRTLPGLDGRAPRPLARLADHIGNEVDYVTNELMLFTDDGDELRGLMERWGGELVRSLSAADLGLTGVPALHLVRVDTTGAGTDTLVADWQALHESRGGAFRVSSDAGLRLLAVAGREAASGLAVGVSWMGQPTDYAARFTIEAPAGFGGFNSSGDRYVGDAYDWHFLNRGSEQDIGATEAWTLLHRAGRLSNRVRIGILDMGFAPDEDFPPGGVAISNVPGTAALGTRNLQSCSGGSACPYHGTNVVGAAMGVPDNGWGSAGPAGPVGEPVLVFTMADPFSAIAAISRAQSNGARIINMSFRIAVPAPFSVVLAPLDAFTGGFRATNLLLFASAGNDGDDIDDQTCIFGCFENTRHWPCESSGVTCVGGLARDSQEKSFFSNWGRGDVDIYAPFWVLVGPDPTNVDNLAQRVAGTSFSSPHAAGVAALIWAANPSLDAGAVERILFETAHIPFPPDSFVNRWVNAFRAVERALPSLVRIESPPEGARISRGSDVEMRAFVWEGGRGAPTLTWSSDRDGVLGTGPSLTRNTMSFGPHRISLTAVFTDGFTAADDVLIEIENDPPQVEITRPLTGATVFPSQLIVARATSFDPNDVETSFRLLDSQLQWFLGSSTTPLATGHATTFALGTATPGPHLLRLRGTDGGGLVGEAAVILNVTADPSNLPPTAEILEPPNGANFIGLGALPVTFRGRATDPEDGDVSDTLVWTASLNGGPFVEIGRGPLFTIPLATANPANVLDIQLVAVDRSGVPSAPDTIRIVLSQLI